MHPALVGFGLGFLVALQLGPMSLFLIRSTLRAGWRVGLAIGAGIAAVDGLDAACGAAGAAPLLDIEPLRMALGIAGGALLIVIGIRTLHEAFKVRLGLEAAHEVADPRRALTSVAGTASNPATIASWAAIFAAASTAGAAPTTSAAVLLIGAWPSAASPGSARWRARSRSPAAGWERERRGWRTPLQASGCSAAAAPSCTPRPASARPAGRSGCYLSRGRSRETRRSRGRRSRNR